MELIAELKDKKAEMASWRQHLHQFPEIAYEEEITSDFVAEKMKSFGIEVHRGLGKTGVVGVIHGQDSGDGQTGCMPAAMMAIQPCCLARRNIWPGIVTSRARSIAFSSRLKKVAMRAQGP